MNEDEDFNGSVQAEGHKDWIQSFGEMHPEREWILSDWDVWERNPFFMGKRTNGHPEDDYRPKTCLEAFNESGLSDDCYHDFAADWNSPGFEDRNGRVQD